MQMSLPLSFHSSPLRPTPLCPVKGKKEKEGDKSLMRAPLISLGCLCSTSFLPAIILPLLRSCQRFRGLRLSALVPRSTRLCLLALSSLHLTLCDGRRHHPKSSPSQAATISVAASGSEMAFSVRSGAIGGTGISFLTMNS